MEKIYNELVSVLNRSFGKRWFLEGPTLCYFIRNYTLKGCADIHIGYSGSIKLFLSFVCRIGFRREGNVYLSQNGVRWILNERKEISGIYEEFARDYERVKLHFPFNIGEECDNANANWTEEPRLDTYKYPPYTFFGDEKRRENGYNLISNLIECGKKAGIHDKMFIGFGTLLGYALCGGFIPGDDDIDMCVLADDIPQEQLHQYLVECKNMKLTENRLRGPVSIDGKYCWVSIGDKSPYTENGVKACNWFWFKFSGMWWHSKGKKWIGHRALDKNYPTAKGIPEGCFNEKFKQVKFGPVDVNVPNNIGKCLDYWYPGFVTRKSESSKVVNLLLMPTERKETWYIIKK